MLVLSRRLCCHLLDTRVCASVALLKRRGIGFQAFRGFEYGSVGFGSAEFRSAAFSGVSFTGVSVTGVSGGVLGRGTSGISTSSSELSAEFSTSTSGLSSTYLTSSTSSPSGSGLSTPTSTSELSSAMDQKVMRKKEKGVAVPQPSSSVLLISPTNQILLLHRIKAASAFPSAHVFPGGALSPQHDGSIPSPTDPARHADGPAYRLAAIRETFEECGILLAKSKSTGVLGAGVTDEEREEGRRAVHAGTVEFGTLCERWGVVPDVDALVPFTRWVTPPHVAKRFSAQMYIYFLPLDHSASAATSTAVDAAAPDGQAKPDAKDTMLIPSPTHDGGIEHTSARFLPAHTWLDLARRNEIILFPPQFFLMYLVAPYLSPPSTSTSTSIITPTVLSAQRADLTAFLARPRTYAGETEVSFADACISPLALGRGVYGGAVHDGPGGLGRDVAVLALEKPGEEVERVDPSRKGIREWVVCTRFKREGPRDVQVRRREEVVGGEGKL